MHHFITKLFALCVLGAITVSFILVYYTDDTFPRYYKSKIFERRVNWPDRSKSKFILQWASPSTYKGFTEDHYTRRQCTYTNCVVTANRSFLSDVTKYDVIIFYAPDILNLKRNQDLPKTRSTHQKFVIASRESSQYYPVCLNSWDGFFNWSWTYRLDSDVSWTYLIIKDSSNNVIGPNKIMHWMKFGEMVPVSEEFKAHLKSKTKAAAWFVSNCDAKSGRKKYADKLKMELAEYNHTLDVYGKCGTMKCGHSEPRCDRLIKDYYYFYLSFENSFSEDYVTEKLTRALQFNAVPIVFGFANYTRFMPDGIYLHAKDFSPKALAAKMNELIRAPDEYANYFRWTNHYSYHSRYEDEAPENSDYCNVCAVLNDEKRMKKPSVIQNFQKWWDNPDQC